MLTTTLAVNGRTIGTLTLTNRGPVGEEGDDPGGRRRYLAVLYREDGSEAGSTQLVHARRDGAWLLARSAIGALLDQGAIDGWPPARTGNGPER